mgnify:CR=1 FL=1
MIAAVTRLRAAARVCWFSKPRSRKRPSRWKATARADYYYQADSFAQIFNAANDQLDSYSQINASLRFENEGSGLYASVFVKNIADDDVVTDLYLTDQSSGLFTNAFLLEPRTFGVTLGKRF